jgi:pyruvate dehydrogenase E2 component (dihydrolipoamide acetyltransferase)
VAKDVEAFAATGGSSGSVVAAAAATEAVKTVAAGVELGSVVPFTTMQNAVSRNMVESLAVPTFRVGYTITTDALDALYKKVIFCLSFCFCLGNVDPCLVEKVKL